MVDIDTWRQRIGTHTHRPGWRQIQVDKMAHGYDPESRWSRTTDFNYRMVSILIVMCLIGAIHHTSVFLINNCLQADGHICRSSTDCTTSPQSDTTMHTAMRYINIDLSFLLYRSGDVEVNPGPISLELQELRKDIIDQIRSSEEKLLKEITSVKEDIKSMKAEIGEIRSEVNLNKGELELQRLDIDSVNDRSDQIESYFYHLEARVEDQERRSRKNNMVLYGVAEGETETYTECKHKVLGIINKAREVKQLQPLVARDIEIAHRISTKSDKKTRPVIVKMCKWEDKWHSVKLREAFRKDGIGIANDLTLFQRQELNRLRSERPTTRFYYKGNKLVEEEKETEERSVDNSDNGIENRGDNAEQPSTSSGLSMRRPSRPRPGTRLFGRGRAR